MSWHAGCVLGSGPDGRLYIRIRGGAVEEPGQRNGLGLHIPESASSGVLDLRAEVLCSFQRIIGF